MAEELAAKSEQYVAMRTVMVRFSYHKTFDSFDVSVHPALARKKRQALVTDRFIEHGENVVFLGPPDTRKTHLAVALGLKAVQQGYRTVFTAALPLIATLTKAEAENRLEKRLKQYGLPKLLISDEIGYIPIDRHGANLFFQLISRRYERGAIMLTSNQSFGQWAEGFGDSIIATAVLDRLLHHSHVLNMRGDSYRLKEKQKAGFLKRGLAPEPVYPRGVGDFSVIEKGPLSIIVDTCIAAMKN